VVPPATDFAVFLSALSGREAFWYTALEFGYKELKAVSTLAIEPLPVPLRQDETGAIRVGKTRVLLELVLHAFQDGATPETIVQRYETLQLADVYAVIGYYLTHRQELDAYLSRREEKAVEVRRRIEAAMPSRPGFRDELRARRARKEDGHAPAGQ
jgi:uncharacterized protein (DUF433 family)